MFLSPEEQTAEEEMVQKDVSLLLPQFTLLQSTLVPPPPPQHTHTLSLGRSALAGENTPERVTWPPAQQPALSCAGPGHPTSQTTVFDSLLRGCQVELLSHSAVAGGAERHGSLPRR